MAITIDNQTPYTLHVWWLDGNLGKKQPDMLPKTSITMNTFISHTFIGRADFVEGNTLTNEVL
jgi:hypothetical protein